MTPQQAWEHLDRLTRGRSPSRVQAFGHRQLVDLARELDAAGRADIEDVLLVLVRGGSDPQRRFAAAYWGVVAPSARVFGQVVEAYLRAPMPELEQVLGQVLGLPWREGELDRLQAHFLEAPAEAPGLLFNLLTARPHEAGLWGALEELTGLTDDHAELYNLYGTAAAIGRGQELLPLLADKPEPVLQRIAAALWGEDKERFVRGLGLA